MFDRPTLINTKGPIAGLAQGVWIGDFLRCFGPPLKAYYDAPPSERPTPQVIPTPAGRRLYYVPVLKWYPPDTGGSYVPYNQNLRNGSI